jgi:hypothetical protein
MWPGIQTYNLVLHLKQSSYSWLRMNIFQSCLTTFSIHLLRTMSCHFFAKQTAIKLRIADPEKLSYVNDQLTWIYQ